MDGVIGEGGDDHIIHTGGCEEVVLSGVEGFVSEFRVGDGGFGFGGDGRTESDGEEGEEGGGEIGVIGIAWFAFLNALSGEETLNGGSAFGWGTFLSDGFYGNSNRGSRMISDEFDSKIA